MQAKGSASDSLWLLHVIAARLGVISGTLVRAGKVKDAAGHLLWASDEENTGPLFFFFFVFLQT